MDIGAEISKKIQMAITAKLKELDAYVDDELPDYIMIMVANKKTEAQMTDALSLFLSNNTKTFTSWLHQLLTSLRKGKSDRKSSQAAELESVSEQNGSERPVTVKQESVEPKSKETERPVTMKQESVELKTKEKQSVKETESVKKTHKTRKSSIKSEPVTLEALPLEDVITINPEHNDFVDELLEDVNLSFDGGKSDAVSKNEESMTKTKKDTSEKGKNLKRRSSDHSSKQKEHGEKQEKVSRRSDEKRSDFKRSGVESRSSRQSSKRTQPPKRDVPLREWDVGKGDRHKSRSSNKRQHEREEGEFYSDSDEDTGHKYKSSLSSAVNQVVQESVFVSESDSDGEITDTKVSSRVAYPKRKFQIPTEKQANKSLFIKAFSAAEKSVKRKPAVPTRREMSPEVVEKPRTRRSNPEVKSRLKGRIGKRISAVNDEDRKTLIRNAVTKVLYSDIAEEKDAKVSGTSSRVGNKTRNLKIRVLNKEKREAGKKLLGKMESEKEVTFVERQSSRSQEITIRDSRKFIITEKDGNKPAVGFDSRRITSSSSTETMTATQAAKISQLISEPVEGTKTPDISNIVSPQQPTPNFIVTLDGVARQQTSPEGVENEGKPTQFKFKRISATPANSTTPEKPIILNSRKLVRNNNKKSIPKVDPSPSTDPVDTTATELQKMKEKLLEVQKESTKLKQMQVKLAAVQAGKIPPTQPPARESTGANTEQRSIYIGNVDYSTSEKQLAEYFSICGKVTRATILKDSVTGYPKGFAYLEFEDKRAVSSALALNNTQLNNRIIRVTLKQPKPSPPVGPTGANFSAARGFYRGFRGRVTARSYRFPTNPSRFGRFGGVKVQAKNKTWINPSIAQASK